MGKLKRESALPGALSSPTSVAGHPQEQYTPVLESSARVSFDQGAVYSQETVESFVRLYKGCCLSILFSLFAADVPLSKTQLCDWTGYADDNVRKGVDRLVRNGLVLAVSNGRHPLYELTARSRQLPFSWNSPERRALPTSTPALPAGPDLLDSPEGEASPIKSDSTASVVVDLKDTDSLNNQDLKTTTSLNPTPIKSESSGLDPISAAHVFADALENRLYDRYFEALRAGKVWPSAAKGLAKRLVEGEIRLSPVDVLGIVVWAQAEAENMGAFVQHHVSAGNLPDDESYRPPVDYFDEALEWVKTDRYKRNSLFVMLCQGCGIVVRDWLDSEWKTCPECEKQLVITPAKQATGLPRWGDDP